MYAQDSWKVTRKLTLDYGLRWDLQQPLNELHDRMISFSPTTPNPTANGLLGAVIYAGNGAKRCNCLFAPYYPYAIAPRLGLAYQLDPKTVLRGGFGISYGSPGPAADRSFRFRHGLQLGHHSVARATASRPASCPSRWFSTRTRCSARPTIPA